MSDDKTIEVLQRGAGTFLQIPSSAAGRTLRPQRQSELQNAVEAILWPFPQCTLKKNSKKQK
jgi:hypothetical protein